MASGESAIRAYATTKRFGADTIQRWLGCSAADQQTIYDVVGGLRLGENQVRDLLDTLEAIALRRGTTPGDALRLDAVRDVLGAGRGRNETLHALKNVLRRLRYPQLAAAESRLQALVKQLDLPVGVSIALPENLEGDEIVLSVRGASATDLRRRMAATAQTIASERVDEMFRVLSGDW